MKTYKNFLFLIVLFLITPVYETRGSQNFIDPSNTGTFIGSNKSMIGLSVIASALFFWTVYKKWSAKNTPPRANNPLIPPNAIIVEDKAGDRYVLSQEVLYQIAEAYENDDVQNHQNDFDDFEHHFDDFEHHFDDFEHHFDDFEVEEVHSENLKTVIAPFNYEKNADAFINFLKTHQESLEIKEFLQSNGNDKKSIDYTVKKIVDVLNTKEPTLFIHLLYATYEQTILTNNYVLPIVGAIVATAEKSQALWRSETYGNINLLYTHEKYKNKNFDLINAMAHECTKRNFQSLYCPINKNDADTIKLLQESGWKCLDSNKGIHTSTKNITMRKELIAQNNNTD